MTATNETNWVESIGKPAFGSIREMVAALECDYERLEELREARDDYELPEEVEGEEVGTMAEEWAKANPDDAEELKELEAAAKPCGETCNDRDDAERMIQEDALSVEVRSGWTTPGSDFEAEEFSILLTTGGPAVRIMGELDEHGEPRRAWLEVQDWGKPWTHYYESGAADVLLTYARCFCFAS